MAFRKAELLRRDTLCHTRFHAGGGVFLDDAALQRLINCLVGFWKLRGIAALIDALYRVAHRFRAAQVEDATALFGTVCFLGG